MKRRTDSGTFRTHCELGPQNFSFQRIYLTKRQQAIVRFVRFCNRMPLSKNVICIQNVIVGEIEVNVMIKRARQDLDQSAAN